MRVYIFSPIPYSFLHQRPQKIADQLRRKSVQVTYIEPFGLTEVLAGRKRIRLRDFFISILCHLLAMKMLFPGRHVTDSGRRRSAKEPREEFEILTLPLVLPSNRTDSAFLDRLNAAVCRIWLERTVLGRRECREQDVALVQQPYFGAVLTKNHFSRLYYDSIDDLSVFAGHGSRERLRRYEDNLLAVAHTVFVTSEALETDLRQRIPGLKPVRIANGVDYDRFQELARSSPVPAELASLTGPVAGYVGILRAWFDADLVGQLANRNPDTTFVLVGPYEESAGLRKLKKLRNVLMVGRRPYDQVPAYINAFDVCLIPFRRDAIAEATNPVKVFEYFALGKPVVSTWLRELVPFAEDGLLCLTTTAGEFEASLRFVLQEQDTSKGESRRAVARKNSWEHHTSRMLDMMRGTG